MHDGAMYCCACAVSCFDFKIYCEVPLKKKRKKNVNEKEKKKKQKRKFSKKKKKRKNKLVFFINKYSVISSRQIIRIQKRKTLFGGPLFGNLFG